MEEEKKEVVDEETPIIFCIDISGSMALGKNGKSIKKKQEPIWKRGLNKKISPLKQNTISGRKAPPISGKLKMPVQV